MTVRLPVSCIVATLLLAACSRETPPPPPVAEAAPQPAAAPPPVPVAQRNAYAFNIGTLQAIALRDGGLTVPNDNKTIAINKKPEDVAKLLGDAGLPTTELSLSVQPLLVKTGDRVLLFDTGAGGNMGPGAGKLRASLVEATVVPATVTDIFISHAHGDHIGGLVAADGSLAFPNAKIHMSEDEWKSLRDTKQQATLVTAVSAKVETFKPGAELVPGIVKAVDVKGHTPGHSAYLIGSGTDTLLYVGDMVHHSIISVQQPDWTIAFDGNAAVAQKSRKDVLAKSAADGQRIYAVHFPYPGLGKFEKQGDKIVWVPET